jgi:hypothetical protein
MLDILARAARAGAEYNAAPAPRLLLLPKRLGNNPDFNVLGTTDNLQNSC